MLSLVCSIQPSVIFLGRNNKKEFSEPEPFLAQVSHFVAPYIPTGPDRRSEGEPVSTRAQ